MDELVIVFGFTKGPGTTMTHATRDGNRTLCGRTIPPEWYTDEWADGPECKRCKEAAARRQQGGTG